MLLEKSYIHIRTHVCMGDRERKEKRQRKINAFSMNYDDVTESDEGARGEMTKKR